MRRNWKSSFVERKVNDEFARLKWGVATLEHVAWENWWQCITGNCCHWILFAFFVSCVALLSFVGRVFWCVKTNRMMQCFVFITLQICYWALKLLAIGIIYVTQQTTINSNDLIFILNLSTAVFISQYLIIQPLSNYINLFFPSLSIKGDMTDWCFN